MGRKHGPDFPFSILLMQTVGLRSWKQPLSALTGFNMMNSKSTPIKINKLTILTTYLLIRQLQTHNYSTHLLKLIEMHSQLAKRNRSSHSLCSQPEVVAIFCRTDTLTTRAGCTWPAEWRNRLLVAVLSTRSCCSQTREFAARKLERTKNIEKLSGKSSEERTNRQKKIKWKG